MIGNTKPLNSAARKRRHHATRATITTAAKAMTAPISTNVNSRPKPIVKARLQHQLIEIDRFQAVAAAAGQARARDAAAPRRFSRSGWPF